ncbi:MAG: efflux RND transporter permease subunit [Acidobacteriota bacterium]
MSEAEAPPSEPPRESDSSSAAHRDPSPGSSAGAPGQGKLASFSTSRPVAVLMVFIAAVVFGAFSYQRLAITLMPELSYPTLTVRTEYPGSAPEEVENDISRPIEEALGVISGLSRISSVSRSGVSDVVLEFAWDTDMSEAIQDTLEKLDLVFLPLEAERPLILRFDPSLDPVLELSVAGHGSRFDDPSARGQEEGLRAVRRIAELQVRRALEPIKGVAAVRLRGGLEEEIHIRVDEEQLRRTGLTIQRVIDRLRQENVNVAGGTIKEGRTEYMVRTLNEYENLGQIANTVITSRDGRDVRVRDVAQVVMSHKEREILTRTNGGESVQIDIFKEADANMVALSKRVREKLGEFDLTAYEDALAKGIEPPIQAPQKPTFKFGRPDDDDEEDEPEIGLTEKLFRSEGVLVEVVADRSIFIESSIREVRDTAILGGLLAIMVLFLFLRDFRATAIIAVSIPISLLVTFAPLNVLGVTLNIMSLGGLALGIGMLVDSSIVVLESIFRCREEGDDVVTAAVRGTREVRGAVIASTLTSIAVFFPMVFVEGVAGQAFGDLGLAVVISLLAALVVAVAFIPMLASRRGIDSNLTESIQSRLFQWHSWSILQADLRAARGWLASSPAVRFLPWLAFCLYLLVRFTFQAFLELCGQLILGLTYLVIALGSRILWPLIVPIFYWLSLVPLRLVGWLLDRLQDTYPRGLRWALRNPASILLLATLLFVATGWLVSRLDSELLPEVHQGEFTVEVALPVGTPLEETDDILQPIETAILAERESMRSLLLTVGYDAASSQRSDEGEHTARFKVLLDSSDPLLETRVVNRLRDRFADIPDLEARVVRPVLFSFKTPVEVEIHGDDLDELRRYAQRFRDVMAAMPELADVDTTQRAGAPEVQIVYNRDLLARYDLNIQQVAQQVRNAVAGFEATRFNLRDRRIPILVRFAEDDRSTVDDVRALLVNAAGDDRPIRLSAVADVQLGEGPSEVRRIDGRRVALVRANIAQGSLGGAVDRIDSELHRQIELPPGMAFFITGQSQEWERSQASLLLALGLSVFLVYVIMAAQFESLFYPLVIMLTIPLAFLGTFLALDVLGISLSIVVFLGMIMLAGIVVNNAIVLVDYINTLKRRGLSREEAVVTAGSVRLRPILMTTATTVLGLTPMALGLGDGAEIRTPMAIAVISGLLASTVLTLIIIPTIYALFDRLQSGLAGRSDEDESRARNDDEAEDFEVLPGADPEGAVT